MNESVKSVAKRVAVRAAKGAVAGAKKGAKQGAVAALAKKPKRTEAIRELARHREGDRPRMTLAKDRVHMALSQIQSLCTGSAAPGYSTDVHEATADPLFPLFNDLRLAIISQTDIGVRDIARAKQIARYDPHDLEALKSGGRRGAGQRDAVRAFGIYSKLIVEQPPAIVRVLTGKDRSWWLDLKRRLEISEGAQPTRRRGVRASGAAPTQRGATRPTRGTPKKPPARSGTPKRKVGRVSKGASPSPKQQ